MRPVRCYAPPAIRLTEIWVDDSPGERRAALIESGAIVEVHIQRDSQWTLGEGGAGRIERKTPSGAYIVTDQADEVLIRRNVPQPEGARIGFEITREAICEPGRAKPPEARLIDSILAENMDRALLWETRLSSLGNLPRCNADIFPALEAGLAGTSQVGEVTVSFQRTKAGLVFDVDGIGDALAINLAAAKEIARLLRLYQVGGMVMIDFVAVESRQIRKAVADSFDAAAAADSRSFERSAVNGFGLMQVVRARPRPSVLDQLFGTRIASLSVETQALWLLREAARSSGFGPRTITTTTAIAGLMNSARWANYLIMCERQTGTSLAVVADDRISGYGHVHVAQS